MCWFAHQRLVFCWLQLSCIRARRLRTVRVRSAVTPHGQFSSQHLLFWKKKRMLFSTQYERFYLCVTAQTCGESLVGRIIVVSLLDKKHKQRHVTTKHRAATLICHVAECQHAPFARLFLLPSIHQSLRPLGVFQDYFTAHKTHKPLSNAYPGYWTPFNPKNNTFNFHCDSMVEVSSTQGWKVISPYIRQTQVHVSPLWHHQQNNTTSKEVEWFIGLFFTICPQRIPEEPCNCELYSVNTMSLS